MNTAFAAALLDPDTSCPAACAPGTARTADAPLRRPPQQCGRLAGRRAGDTFPVVQALVGADFFRAMAARFRATSRRASPLMHRYGARLRRLHRQFRARRPLPYLADVARLEFARVQACHAADAAPLSRRRPVAALGSGGDLAALRAVVASGAGWPSRIRRFAVGRAPGRGRPRRGRPRRSPRARWSCGRTGRAGPALRSWHARVRRRSHAAATCRLHRAAPGPRLLPPPPWPCCWPTARWRPSRFPRRAPMTTATTTVATTTPSPPSSASPACCGWPSTRWSAFRTALIALLARFSIAAVFWLGADQGAGLCAQLRQRRLPAGLAALSDSRRTLFREEYRLPLIAPELGAVLAAAGEHVFPVLLLLGLGDPLFGAGPAGDDAGDPAVGLPRRLRHPWHLGRGAAAAGRARRPACCRSTTGWPRREAAWIR